MSLLSFFSVHPFCFSFYSDFFSFVNHLPAFSDTDDEDDDHDDHHHGGIIIPNPHPPPLVVAEWWSVFCHLAPLPHPFSLFLTLLYSFSLFRTLSHSFSPFLTPHHLSTDKAKGPGGSILEKNFRLGEIFKWELEKEKSKKSSHSIPYNTFCVPDFSRECVWDSFCGFQFSGQ